MNPNIHVQPAVHNLVRCLVDGTGRPVYVHTDAGWECIWDDGVLAIFVRAQNGAGGLDIEVGIKRRSTAVAVAVPEAA